MFGSIAGSSDGVCGAGAAGAFLAGGRAALCSGAGGGGLSAGLAGCSDGEIASIGSAGTGAVGSETRSPQPARAKAPDSATRRVDAPIRCTAWLLGVHTRVGDQLGYAFDWLTPQGFVFDTLAPWTAELPRKSICPIRSTTSWQTQSLSRSAIPEKYSPRCDQTGTFGSAVCLSADWETALWNFTK